MARPKVDSKSQAGQADAVLAGACLGFKRGKTGRQPWAPGVEACDRIRMDKERWGP